MYLLVSIALCLLFGFRVIWGLLDRPWVARSPFRIVAVGLLTCLFGFVAQDQIHRVEILSGGPLANVPQLVVDRSTLSLINRFVEVVVYAAGAGIIASAMFLRSQLCFEGEKKRQVQRLLRATETIRCIERDLKFAEVDSQIYGGNAEARQNFLWTQLMRREEAKEEAHRRLQEMGEQLGS